MALFGLTIISQSNIGFSTISKFNVRLYNEISVKKTENLQDQVAEYSRIKMIN